MELTNFKGYLMSKEYTLSPLQVQDALIDYMKECIIRDGLKHTYNFSFKQEITKHDDGRIEVMFKGVVVKVD